MFVNKKKWIEDFKAHHIWQMLHIFLSPKIIYCSRELFGFDNFFEPEYIHQ
jgi:hypothetical protein